jgi:hypothetical protein
MVIVQKNPLKSDDFGAFFQKNPLDEWHTKW